MDDDDDFGDFGGFEEAEAVAPAEAQPVIDGAVAAPSPWAVFGMGQNVNPQPDLLQAQAAPGGNVAPPFIEVEEPPEQPNGPIAAPDLGNGASQGGSVSKSSGPLLEDHILDGHFQPPVSMPTKSFTNEHSVQLPPAGVLDLDLGQGTVQPPMGQSQNQPDLTEKIPISGAKSNRQPDLTNSDKPTGATEKALSNGPDVTNKGASNIPDLSKKTLAKAPDVTEKSNSKPSSSKKTVDSNDFDISLDFDDELNLSSTQNAIDAAIAATVPSGEKKASTKPATDEKMEQKVKELENKLSLADEEKERIKKDLENMNSSQKELEAELSKSKEDLEAQKEKYNELQVKHDKDLEDIRKAGHDALAVIVEEYKELCKTAVLEQQQLNEEHFKELLKSELEKYDKEKAKQSDEFQKILEEEKSNMQEAIKTAIEKQKKTSKEYVEKCIKNEQEKQREILEKALEEERQKSKDAIREAVKEEQVKSQAFIDDEKKKLLDLLDEERERGKEAIATAVAEQNVSSKTCLSEAIEAERSKASEATQTAINAARDDMKTYINEQKQADSSLRQRQYASMDLFLESTRKSLQLLMSQPPGSGGDGPK
ncbi:unnamed protein product [Owenia fusiformis]|uniref:Uncharacterized protein n=1 Tax=Owenia fusiformis TaxID=6347 RepID=A0A8J1U0E8_OWEFU|nr:unnamed protein product [Owenia fusiformis]